MIDFSLVISLMSDIISILVGVIGLYSFFKPNKSKRNSAKKQHCQELYSSCKQKILRIKNMLIIFTNKQGTIAIIDMKKGTVIFTNNGAGEVFPTATNQKKTSQNPPQKGAKKGEQQS